MTNEDIEKLLAEAEAFLRSQTPDVRKEVTKELAEIHTKVTKKVASIKPKKQPVIRAGAHYHYDPATYNSLHKMPNWHYVEDVDAMVNELTQRLEAKRLRGEILYLAIDTETTSSGVVASAVPSHIIRRYVKKKPQDFPFGISISDGIDSWFFEKDFDKVKLLLEDETIEKILQNAKFDLHELRNIGIVVKGRIWDTLVMAKLVNENRNGFTLKDMAKDIVFQEADKWEIMLKNWMSDNKCNDYAKVPKELMGDYGAGDTWWTFKIFEHFKPLITEFNLDELCSTESAMIYVLLDMERAGFKTNRAYLEALGKELEAEVRSYETEIYSDAGQIFNINSGQQLYKVLLKLGVPQDEIKIKEETGNPILDGDELERLADNYPIAHKVVEMKYLEKLKGTYVDGVLKILTASDKVHGNFNQTEATTGRMSSTDPNLQNLPKKDKRIRKAYVPSEGYVLFFYDFDQVEYRLFAHYSQDENLIAAIKRGWDVHMATAAILFNKNYNEVTEDERSRGKTMNFALIYGMGIDALAGSLKVSSSEAKRIKRDYFAALPNAQTFLMTVQETCKQRGYIRNFYMRRRRLTKNEIYKAPNALIQGCAADHIKKKMVLLHEYLKDKLSRLVNVVHDEVIVEIHLSEIDVVAPMIKQIMDDYTTFRVPITCGCEFSLISWGQKADYDLTKSFEENKKDFYAKYGEAI